MKRKLHILTPLLVIFLIAASAFTSSSNVQNNHSYFDGYTFTLDHILINNVETDVDLTNPFDPSLSYDLPTIQFSLNSTSNVLEVTGGIYCNAFSANYTDNGSQFTVSDLGLTLMECTSATNYFSILESTVSGEIQSTPISYEIATDLSGFWMWTDPNQKVYYTRGVLSTSSYELEKEIKIFPVPAEDFIQVNSNSIPIKNVSIIDLNGKEVLSVSENFSEIVVSQLTSGLYICKVNTERGVLTKKIVKK